MIMQQVSGLATFGGNPPSLHQDAHGVLFLGFNDKSRGTFYRVQQITPDSRRIDVPLQAEFGQARLEVWHDGLYVVGFLGNGDNRTIAYHRIDAYVPHKPLNLAGMWDGKMTSANENDGLMFTRWNNLRETLKRNSD